MDGCWVMPPMACRAARPRVPCAAVRPPRWTRRTSPRSFGTAGPTACGPRRCSPSITQPRRQGADGLPAPTALPPSAVRPLCRRAGCRAGRRCAASTTEPNRVAGLHLFMGRANGFTRLSATSDALPGQCEKMRVLKTQCPELVVAIKTPGLRNVAATAPTRAPASSRPCLWCRPTTPRRARRSTTRRSTPAGRTSTSCRFSCRRPRSTSWSTSWAA